jgi:hypothetical protein
VLVVYLVNIHLITRPHRPALRAGAVCSPIHAGPGTSWMKPTAHRDREVVPSSPRPYRRPRGCLTGARPFAWAKASATRALHHSSGWEVGGDGELALRLESAIRARSVVGVLSCV